MKTVFCILLVLFAAAAGAAQNEQSPIVEKEIAYKNWKLKNVRGEGDTEVRDLAKGKNLLVVVYFAPWCPNWRHDAPMLERFYQKYKASGLEIVGISEYDTPDAAKVNLDTLKVTFPVVIESLARSEKQTTALYTYRKSTGDNRNWGSPWYIFLEPALLEKDGDILVKKTSVINGEMIETEGEKFIRQKLGLPAEETKATAKAGEIDACDPEKKTVELKKP
ncbi:MAG: TlpA disulfide reductase family protein [Acidobacteriota bacterium]